MSEEYLVQYCAPTLAGIKTGNLFSCVCDDRADVNDTIRSVNLRLGKKGLRLLLSAWYPSLRIPGFFYDSSLISGRCSLFR